MKLLIILLASLLSAKTLWVVNTDDLLGRCVFECGDVIITNPLYVVPDTPSCITVVECESLECVEHTKDRYSSLYRTNGIGMEEIK